MAAISINLLPQELEKNKKEHSKQIRAIQISIGILLLVIGIATFVLIVRVSQNVSLSDLKRQDTTLTSKISSSENQLKDGLARSLKDRLTAISTVDKKERPGDYIYNLVLQLSPTDIQYTAISLDKKSNITLSGQTVNNASIEELFNNITNKDVNQGKFIGASVDSLSKDIRGIYKFEVTVFLLGAPPPKKT